LWTNYPRKNLSKTFFAMLSFFLNLVGVRLKFIILLISLPIACFFAQKGNYFLHNYLPSQYNASDQNRAILQDLYGRIFVANNDGVLVHTGTEWDKLNLPFLCLSMEKDAGEQVYVAGDEDFGKVVQNKNGEYEFQSLKNLLPESIKNNGIGRIWSIICLSGHVYFCSNTFILDYNYKRIETIASAGDGFHTFFKVGDKLVLREKSAGLKYLSVTGELHPFKAGYQFADNANPVRGIIHSEKNIYYIICPNSVYELKMNSAIPELSEINVINTPIAKWLSEKTVYTAANIGKDFFAFGSVSGGLLITDRKFQPVNRISSANDLQDDGVNYIYNDVQGHIWLALAKGISFIEFNSPVTRFGKADGVKGTVESCIFYKGTPFIATDKGIFRYNNATFRFEPTNLTETAWYLTDYNGSLLAGTKNGLYLLDGNNFNPIFESYSAIHFIFAHPKHENLVYLGTENGCVKGNFIQGKFNMLSALDEMEDDIRSIAFTEEGEICMASTENGLYIETEQGKLVHIGHKEGLPELKENCVFQYKEKTLIASDDGIYKIEKHKVFPDPDFKIIQGKYIVLRAVEINGEVWCTVKRKEESRTSRSMESFICLAPGDQGFTLKPMQLSRIKESNVKSFCFNDKLVYIGTNNGVFCYDRSLQSKGNFLNTFINAFTPGKDSTHYYSNINPKTNFNKITLQFENNSIEIKLGASDFIDKNELQFAWYLKNRDTGYSFFSNNKTVTLDHVHEGDYEFIVKSRNILGIEGQEIRVPFTVLPPWYRTFWAYVFYFLTGAGIILLLIKLNSRRLIEQNIKLENIIHDRTKEINQQKLLIEHKNREITDSINYAKGIQDSILPGINEIKKAWQDLFIFFQPKDIVSGDFYWFKQIDKHQFLIACADCTGHGVPGGFMSMICSDKLHAAASVTTEPDQILFLANNSIKETLRQQNEGKSKDGMEICLLKINTQTGNVKYSGANRSLWILYKESTEITEIKGTKASIASFTEFNFTYQLHDFNLKPGDTLYASSDGYPDQFGGDFGKKYMSKNLKNLIISHASLPMNEQEEILRIEIKSWMKHYEQVDDLLVIGIRL
jgi:serine phosphatase RsbU (regulator of sigma subunit)